MTAKAEASKNKPGHKEIHQAVKIKFFPCSRIAPQSGVGGATPKPKKPNAASICKAKGNKMTYCIRIKGNTLGATCLNKI